MGELRIDSRGSCACPSANGGLGEPALPKADLKSSREGREPDEWLGTMDDGLGFIDAVLHV